MRLRGQITYLGDCFAMDYKAAQERFRQLYVAELSMVESPDVEGRMVELAPAVAPELGNLNDAQLAALHLAHALRDSLRESWGRDTIPRQPDTAPRWTETTPKALR